MATGFKKLEEKVAAGGKLTATEQGIVNRAATPKTTPVVVSAPAPGQQTQGLQSGQFFTPQGMQQGMKKAQLVDEGASQAVKMQVKRSAITEEARQSEAVLENPQQYSLQANEDALNWQRFQSDTYKKKVSDINASLGAQSAEFQKQLTKLYSETGNTVDVEHPEFGNAVTRAVQAGVTDLKPVLKQFQTGNIDTKLLKTLPYDSQRREIGNMAARAVQAGMSQASADAAVKSFEQTKDPDVVASYFKEQTKKTPPIKASSAITQGNAAATTKNEKKIVEKKAVSDLADKDAFDFESYVGGLDLETTNSAAILKTILLQQLGTINDDTVSNFLESQTKAAQKAYTEAKVLAQVGIGEIDAALEGKDFVPQTYEGLSAKIYKDMKDQQLGDIEAEKEYLNTQYDAWNKREQGNRARLDGYLKAKMYASGAQDSSAALEVMALQTDAADLRLQMAEGEHNYQIAKLNSATREIKTNFTNGIIQIGMQAEDKKKTAATTLQSKLSEIEGKTIEDAREKRKLSLEAVSGFYEKLSTIETNRKADEWKKKEFAYKQTRDVIEDGQKALQFEDSAKTQLQKEYEYWKSTGGTGGPLDYLKEKSAAEREPNATSVNTSPYYNEAIAAGFPPEAAAEIAKKRYNDEFANLTESQAKSFGAYKKMNLENKNYDDLTKGVDSKKFADTINTISKRLKGGDLMSEVVNRNFVKPEVRRAIMSEMRWIEGKLRKESGASITAQEYIDNGTMYFPRAGDDAAEIERKKQARLSATESLAGEMGASGQRLLREDETNKPKVSAETQFYEYADKNPNIDMESKLRDVKALMPNASEEELYQGVMEILNPQSFNNVGGDTNIANANLTSFATGADTFEHGNIAYTGYQPESITKALDIDPKTFRAQCGRLINGATGIGVGDSYESKMAKTDPNIKSPVPGLVGVMPTSKPYGHIFYITGISEDGKNVLAYDANWNEKNAPETLDVHPIPISKITGYAMPKEGSKLYKFAQEEVRKKQPKPSFV